MRAVKNREQKGSRQRHRERLMREGEGSDLALYHLIVTIAIITLAIVYVVDQRSVESIMTHGKTTTTRISDRIYGFCFKNNMIYAQIYNPISIFRTNIQKVRDNTVVIHVGCRTFSCRYCNWGSCFHFPVFHSRRSACKYWIPWWKSNGRSSHW